MSWKPITGTPRGSLVPITEGSKAMSQAGIIRDNFHPYQVASELAQAMNKPNSRFMIGKIFKKWHHNIDTDRINALSGYLDSVVDYNKRVMNAKYEMAVSQQTLQRMIEGEKSRLDMIANEAVAEHERRITRLKNEDKREAKEIERAGIDNAIEKELGEQKVNHFKEKIRGKKVVHDFIESVAQGKIDLNNASPNVILLYSQIMKYGKESDINSADIIDERIQEQAIEEMEIQNKILRATLKERKSEAKRTTHENTTIIGDNKKVRGGRPPSK